MAMFNPYNLLLEISNWESPLPKFIEPKHLFLFIEIILFEQRNTSVQALMAIWPMVSAFVMSQVEKYEEDSTKRTVLYLLGNLRAAVFENEQI